MDEDDYIHAEDVLDGRTEINISHAGDEFYEDFQAVMEEEKSRACPKRPDWRARRDRIEWRTRAFDSQMDDMLSMYIEWVGEGEAAPFREADGDFAVHVVDILDSFVLNAELDSGGRGIAAALIRQGMFPCAPWDPTVVITTRTLELFQTAHVRCPQLAILSFVKTLCDLHGSPYRPYLYQQFT
ncbi:hypothetical protein B0H14DRAFT_3586674 [Mycena olivaceomarginata]|nr:hypothetical protein B0H14DRAFT_3586674 [Mycena olivaceomarginata]